MDETVLNENEQDSQIETEQWVDFDLFNRFPNK